MSRYSRELPNWLPMCLELRDMLRAVDFTGHADQLAFRVAVASALALAEQMRATEDKRNAGGS